MSGYRQRCIVAALLFFTCLPHLQANELKIAVASNFYHNLSELLQQSDFVDQVKLSSGSTGLLYAQIKKGAPFDVFLSADSERPALLSKQGVAYTPITYAVGQLVLWPTNKSIETKLSNYKSKLAIANPRLAPYGSAASEVLAFLGLTRDYESRLIKANNINQAFQFTDSGNAQLSLLAKAQLLQAGEKALPANKSKYDNYQEIPADWHKPITQQMVILKRTKQLALAQQFQAWMLSVEVQQKLLASGYREG